jgi:hypothetical protein
MVEPAMLPSKPSSQSTSKITRMVQSMWGTVLSGVVPGRISRPRNPSRSRLPRLANGASRLGCRDLNRSARKHVAGYQRMKDKKPKNRPRSVQSILLPIETIPAAVSTAIAKQIQATMINSDLGL